MINDKVKFFKALGDETRLKIVKYLLGHEGCVRDVTAILKKNQTTISRHLKILTDADILKFRKMDRHIIYSIKNSEVRKVLSNFGIKPKC